MIKLASKVITWKIFDPDRGGFRGVVRGKSNNKLQPGQCSDMYNYLSDGGPVKRKGNTIDNDTELVANTGITGIFQFYNGSEYKTFVKCGTRLFDVREFGNSPYLLTNVTESGDSANQLSNWNIVGAGNANTDNGTLYCEITNSGTTRTVKLYKSGIPQKMAWR